MINKINDYLIIKKDLNEKLNKIMSEHNKEFTDLCISLYKPLNRPIPNSILDIEPIVKCSIEDFDIYEKDCYRFLPGYSDEELEKWDYSTPFLFLIPVSMVNDKSNIEKYLATKENYVNILYDKISTFNSDLLKAYLDFDKDSKIKPILIRDLYERENDTDILVKLEYDQKDLEKLNYNPNTYKLIPKQVFLK